MLIHVETQPIFLVDMPDMTMVKNNIQKRKKEYPEVLFFIQLSGEFSLSKRKQKQHLISLIAENQEDFLHFIMKLNVFS